MTVCLVCMYVCGYVRVYVSFRSETGDDHMTVCLVGMCISLHMYVCMYAVYMDMCVYVYFYSSWEPEDDPMTVCLVCVYVYVCMHADVYVYMYVDVSISRVHVSIRRGFMTNDST